MIAWFVTSALVLGVAGFLLGGGPLRGSASGLKLDVFSLIVGLVLIVAALGTVILHRRRLISLIVMGAVGLVVSLTFVKFSAPDLALTQLSVEIVTIILLLLALYYLPQRQQPESGWLRRGRDLILAVTAGTGAGLLSWAILTRRFESISGYFLDNSVSGGGGTNVVNVILVDFRGFDTLGEITVLALAALGIYAMLQQLSLDAPEKDMNGRRWNPDVHPAIMSTLTRLLLPLSLLVALFILLRGHNLPGGGFIAGLVTAVALVTQYLANGARWMQARMPANMHPVIAIGLLVATLTGLGSGWFGYPFLTSTFTHVHWPVVGEFELASAMLFDLGVYLTVVGATLLILIFIGILHSGDPGSSAKQKDVT